MGRYPNKPGRIIVPFPLGAGSMARVVAQKIFRPIGQNVFIENRTGNGSMVGTEAAARSAPDGCTLLLAAASAMVINLLLQKLHCDPVKRFELTS